MRKAEIEIGAEVEFMRLEQGEVVAKDLPRKAASGRDYRDLVLIRTRSGKEYMVRAERVYAKGSMVLTRRVGG